MSVLPAFTSGRRRTKGDPWELSPRATEDKDPWATGSTLFDTQQSIWSCDDRLTVPPLHSAASVFDDDASAASSRRVSHRRAYKLIDAQKSVLPLSGVVLNVRYDARTDDRRRSALGWNTSTVLDQLGLFDALDALELVAVFNRTQRRLAMNAPLLTPCVRAVINRLNRAKSLLLPADFSTLRSIDRLAVLKDDPKLPVPIFRELDQFLCSHPQLIISLASGYFSLPTYSDRNGSLDRIAHALSNWGSSHYPPQSFLGRLNVQPELAKLLPLTIPSQHTGVVLEVPLTRVCDVKSDSTQAYCLLAPQHLEVLLKSVQNNHMEHVELREEDTQAFILAAPSELDDVRLLSCLVDLLDRSSGGWDAHSQTSTVQTGGDFSPLG